MYVYISMYVHMYILYMVSSSNLPEFHKLAGSQECETRKSELYNSQAA